MEEFENDSDIELNKPLDPLFVILGLAMIIFGLTTLIFVENTWGKYIGFFCFLASLSVMTKKSKEINLQ